MSDPTLEIRIAESAPARPPARRRSARRWIISTALIALLAVATVVLALARRQDDSHRPVAKPAPVTRAADEPSPAGPAAPSAHAAIDDPSGALLWVSPTAGPPLSLAYVPAGTQCLVHLRPALLTSHREGERLLASLGPWGDDAVSQLQTLLGVELAQIKSLLLAIVLDEQGQLGASLRVELLEPTSLELVAQRISGEVRQQQGRPYLSSRGRAYFLADEPQPSSAATGTMLVAAPEHLLPELIDADGGDPPLVRDFEALIHRVDADRAVTIVVAPKFLQAGGAELVTAEAAPLHAAFRWLAGADVAALALSAHWDENFFLELRAVPALNIAPGRLAASLRDRIVAAPDLVEDAILAVHWPSYGRKVLARFPAMLRTTSRYCRAGELDRQAIVRCYLPVAAGHNLLMASELLLTQRPGESVAGSPPTARTLQQRLSAPASLSFAKETLERALELLAEEVGVEIVISGADLQLEGITKNQSLALDLRDRPAEEILLEILLRANPDRSASGPADVRQKLVYLLENQDASHTERIIVTTRTAAAKRKEPLPAPFVVPAP